MSAILTIDREVIQADPIHLQNQESKLQVLSHPIDLRSDTVTLPTDEMRRAMAEAVVGDDVYGEDPTVIELERESATLFGKEAGLLLPSGTQANAVATLTHTVPGQLAFCESGAHVGIHEGGGHAALAGIVLEKIRTDDGILRAADVRERILPQDPHLAEPAMIWIENTNNSAGGVPTPAVVMDEVGELAKERGYRLHIDGARIFNAAAALDESPERLSAMADSVQFCLSKGLGAPVGSMLVGTTGFIARARRKRKLLGGAMRQAGVIAAAGLIALREMPARLGTDHVHARRLAEGVSDLPGICLPHGRPATNMVYMAIDDDYLDPPAVVRQASAAGVLIGPVERSGNLSRLVLHHQISADDVEAAIGAIAAAVAKARI